MAELIAITSMLMLPKNLDADLCTGLSHKEFQCTCEYKHCDHTLVSPLLLKSYEDLREWYGKPIKINSGFRCNKRNEEVEGSDTSSHKKGLAVDVSLKGMGTVDRDIFIKTSRKLFSYVREYETFLHLQTNPVFNKEIEY